MQQYEYIKECGSCEYISYSFGSNGLLSGFICTFPRFVGTPVELYDNCHLPRNIRDLSI